MKQNEKLTNTVRAGLFAALTALLTTVLHIPVGSGYIHCGDAVIFLAAATIPLPYAIGAAAIGGMLADVLSGYPMYALPTLVIKALLALVFHLAGGEKLLCPRRVLGLVLGGMVSVTGYWLAAVLLYGGWHAQLIATVPGNCIQALGSGIVYALAAMALEQMPRPTRSA